MNDSSKWKLEQIKKTYEHRGVPYWMKANPTDEAVDSMYEKCMCLYIIESEELWEIHRAVNEEIRENDPEAFLKEKLGQ